MIRNYLKIAWRNLLKNKTFSLINIAGLSIGMAVALLIGLWLHDELTFDKGFPNHDRIVQVMQHQTFNGETGTQTANPYQMAEAIKEKYGADFKHVVQASWPGGYVLSHNDKALSRMGNFFEPGITDMLSLEMLAGTREGLKDVNSIMLSESSAKAFFGDGEAVGQMLKLNNKLPVKVTGVYKDLPKNSEFASLHFICPWSLYLADNPWIRELENPWRSNFTQTYAQLADHADLATVSGKIKNVKMDKVRAAEKAYNPVVFLWPMDKWHLYGDWKYGKNVGGRINSVWLFGIIGIFVLLLACINFMNLSTARSEKRAREVGIRKAVGSHRQQLIFQFFTESTLLALIGFVLSIALVAAVLPIFNDIAGKRMSLPLQAPAFWLSGLAIVLVTGLLAGSYPAFYLSSFQPVKVLKGTFKAGRYAATPRKALVVLQFTVSVVLIIGTLIVFKQIRHAQERPVGYDREGLIYTYISTDELRNHYEAIRSEALATGAVVEMATATSPPNSVNAINNGFTWEGMEAGAQGNFAQIEVSHDYGKAIQWEIIQGRDFSKQFASDSNAIVLNETAVKFMQLKTPIGSVVKKDDRSYKVIGVVKDMIMQSPYTPVFRTVWNIDAGRGDLFLMRLDPGKPIQASLKQLEGIIAKHDPGIPFIYEFVDVQYKQKFLSEQRIGKLSAYFAMLAVFISCLGLFGMASFMAEQRTKEIGVRKVLGASVFSLWRLMSTDFAILVLIALAIAVPLGWWAMQHWLNDFEYRTIISWDIIALTCLGAMSIAILTISTQSIRAALADPVKSLRSE
ncbi:ABC transporter permease [Chitinophaga rhizosphaerae]|uniref:ABC transporter permease n=1 Tax=Chitinophaga rhizosphaerae TaxID=1864947 RepID=UPI000F808CC9|nr:ABC transporter permease [Chitinophaga rhizosphaerae]